MIHLSMFCTFISPIYMVKYVKLQTIFIKRIDIRSRFEDDTFMPHTRSILFRNSKLPKSVLVMHCFFDKAFQNISEQITRMKMFN